MSEWVLHVDLDQFVAAVEVLRDPSLAGKPVVVGGGGDPTQRGVVSTASYEARAFGVGSGMPLRTAARKAPDAIFLPVDGALYTEASEGVMAVLRSFGPTDGAVVEGEVIQVLGWCLFPGSTVARVEVTAGAAQPQRARLGMPRPDVAAECTHPSASICGFSSVIIWAAVFWPCRTRLYPAL